MCANGKMNIENNSRTTETENKVEIIETILMICLECVCIVMLFLVLPKRAVVYSNMLCVCVCICLLVKTDWTEAHKLKKNIWHVRLLIHRMIWIWHVFILYSELASCLSVSTKRIMKAWASIHTTNTIYACIDVKSNGFACDGKKGQVMEKTNGTKRKCKSLARDDQIINGKKWCIQNNVIIVHVCVHQNNCIETLCCLWWWSILGNFHMAWILWHWVRFWPIENVRI